MASFLSNIAESGAFGLGGFLISKSLDKGSNPEVENPFADFELPDFAEDADFRETQDILKKFGTDLLKGDIPEFFAPIGETGGKEFENFLSLMKGDIQESVESGFAATGRSGGVVADVVGKRVGEATTKARFADFVRSLEGKSSLLNTGLNVTQGVRGAGQTQQGQVNAFALDRSALDLRKRGLEFGAGNIIEDRADFKSREEGALFGKLASTVLNAGVGFATGGPVGALVGATSGINFADLLGGSATSSKAAVGTEAKDKLGLGEFKFKNLSGKNIPLSSRDF